MFAPERLGRVAKQSGSCRIGCGESSLRVDGADKVACIVDGSTLFASQGLTAAGTGVVITSSGQSVFNEQSRNVDFRIESDGNANMFFVDASADLADAADVILARDDFVLEEDAKAA